MIEIRRIKPDEAPAAKRLIYRVAQDVFNDSRPLDESIAYYEERGVLQEMDSIQQNYFDNDGIFLVLTEDSQIIGTGVIRKIEDGICELKRLWLLTEYHGKGLGYRMMQELLSFAREKGYERIRLETELTQKRALGFYKRLGFYQIQRYRENAEDIAMEMIL